MLSRPSRLAALAIAAAAALACSSTALAAPPPNDAFASATTLNPTQTVGATAVGTLDGATSEAGEYGAAPGTPTVWYRVVPSYTGTLTIDVCDANVTVRAYPFTGASVDALSLAGLDPGFVCPTLYDGSGSMHVTAGTPIHIRVASYAAVAPGSHFTLRLNSPHNDDLGAAEPLKQDLYGVRGQLFGATKQVGEANHAGDTGGHSVWYTWTSGAAGPAKFSTCSFATGFDTLLGVYSGSVFPLTPVAANDDDTGCPNNIHASTVTFNAAAHTTYRVAVDAFHTLTPEQIASGFQLDVPPQNDQLADAFPISGSVYSGSWSSLATKEPGEPAHAGQPGGASVWWAWTATSSGPTTFDTCAQYPDAPDTLLAVYTGDSYPLTPVASNDDTSRCGLGKSSLVTFDAVAGKTYKIAVDDKTGHGDYLWVNAAVPDNDFFAHPEALSGSGSFDADLISASAEPGEPKHAGSPPMDSRWWTYTAPANGTVHIDTCSTKDFADTLLAVYTGDALGALTPVASSDDVTGCGLFNTGSSVEFAATAGTTYRIAVDLKYGYGGAVTLTYGGPGAPQSPPPPPPPGGEPQNDGPLLGAVHISRARLSRLAHGRFIVTATCLRACGLSATLRTHRRPVASAVAGAGAAKTVKLRMRVPLRKRAALARRRSLRTTLVINAIDPKTHLAAKVVRVVRFRR